MNPHNIQQYVNVVFSAKGQQQVLQYAEQMLKASSAELKQVKETIKELENKGDALTKEEQENLKSLKKTRDALKMQVDTYKEAKSRGVEAFNAIRNGIIDMDKMGTRGLTALQKKLDGVVRSLGDLRDAAGNLKLDEVEKMEAAVEARYATRRKIDMQQHGVASFDRVLGRTATKKQLEDHIKMFDLYALS